MTGRINLNADLGESFGAWEMGSDAELLRIVGAAKEVEADLIILPGPGGGLGSNKYPRLDETIITALRSWPQAILVSC